MTFTIVSDIPNSLPNRKRKDVRGMLDEFIRIGTKYAQVNLDSEDYCRPDTAMQSIRMVAKSYEYPVTVKTRRGAIYIERTDF